MSSQIQITLRDMPHSEPLEARIRQKVAKLERFCPGIVSCRILAEIPHHHEHQGRQYAVRLGVTVPGGEIVVNRDHNEDIFIALRDAFRAVRRQLEDYARRSRGGVKLHRPRRRASEHRTVND